MVKSKSIIMIVKELREILASLPDDMEIIIQKDAEGNGYSPLHGADPDGVYIPENSYSGYVFDTNWTASDACMEEKDWERIKALPRALILHPVN